MIEIEIGPFARSQDERTLLLHLGGPCPIDQDIDLRLSVNRRDAPGKVSTHVGADGPRVGCGTQSCTF